MIGPFDVYCLAKPMLDRARCTHFITGSVASMAYGEVRTTQDIDVVIHMKLDDVHDFREHFVEPDWYLSVEAMRGAIERDGQFNVIHVPSGLKIDFMCAADTAFNASRFARVKQLEIRPGVRVPFSSPEDVILMKLVYFREGGSDKHLRDIGAMIMVSRESLDRGYLEGWASKLGVDDVWEKCKARVGWSEG
jgi:hypothetical protein